MTAVEVNAHARTEMKHTTEKNAKDSRDKGTTKKKKRNEAPRYYLMNN